MTIAIRNRPLGPLGFTLAEILIALGIAAVAVAGVCSLFPLVARISREGEEQARAARIAGNIMDTLASSRGNGRLIATGMNGEDILLEDVPAKESIRHVAYGPSCEPIRKLTPEEAASPLGDPNITDIAILRLGPKKSLPGLLVAEVDVLSPASAPPGGRSVNRFVRLLPLLP